MLSVGVNIEQGDEWVLTNLMNISADNTTAELYYEYNSLSYPSAEKAVISFTTFCLFTDNCHY